MNQTHPEDRHSETMVLSPTTAPVSGSPSPLTDHHIDHAGAHLAATLDALMRQAEPWFHWNQLPGNKRRNKTNG